ncbi:DUF7139 domain-containing protein [Halomarina litorea]|uniref:DUF7139 domain-containing protein n=1 Tax=Halomarina litorea TaxID=2961595 RepID=UPI0020C54B50|nr:permease [Halomarina sp. BCD28]
MSDFGDVEETLVGWYRQYIGEPERRIDVYLGFALFFGGLALGVAGLVLFVAEQAASGEGKLYWLREIAFAIGALGLPALLAGVTVLLPVERRARVGAFAGGAITLAAVGFFVWAYPYQWDTTSGVDYSMQGVAVYAVGLVTVVAVTAAALVSYHVERVAPTESGEAASAGPEVTDEQVRRDIDEAMSGTELTWGGVAKDETRRITFSSERASADAGLDTSGFDGVEAKSVRSSGGSVDAAVAGLQGMRGDADRSERGAGTDDQAEALAALRDQQAQAEAERPDGFVARLRSWLSLG